MKKTIVTIPTYNEKENIRILINSILKLKIGGLEILVIDDNSPDKTYKIVENISKKNKKVHLLLRTEKRGRGYAGKAGFIWALNHKADYIIEMDADLSHNPKYIPQFLEKIKRADVVLGSRLTQGGRDARENIGRRAITKLANMYIRLVLGLNIRDCNSGYRCFTRQALTKIQPEKIISRGPQIVQEVLFKARLKNLKIIEIPITFKERQIGNSKLNITQLWKSYIAILKLRVMHFLGRI
ncbi:MAG: polyprenol monophosphomannose synthase [Nanoarchaeota archaeon]|nr:polyprenol monophosphomannose synthase [Nanoarchaeota archaeon]MBU1945999.1 polyprenol monophosphomannose synthase [Nanoarchaeota archaeon]